MAYNKKRNNNRNNERAKAVNCSCGDKARLSSRKNYPFGRKSDSITRWFYRCISCKKTMFVNENKGGRR